MRRGSIRVQNISKRYNLHNSRGAYRTLRDTLSESISAPLRRNRSNGKGTSEHWALRDVSFDVAPGQVVGIVGRNGAGKSTVLKILSRITEPTSGRAETCGRVASLLEVGTGFHVELSGRENIYLNGAILGMPRREIEQKFDDIVQFAEVEKFVDTPVKRYSSGMYLRLAFAVSAHLEPEILVVDEVLAVGDAEFQKKCLGKMEDVARDGRTVLFVSHNMAAVRMLCNRGILLNQGQIVFDGPIQEVTRQYLAVGQERSGERTWPEIDDAPGNDVVKLHSVRIMKKNGDVTGEVSIHDEVLVEIRYWVRKAGYPLDTLCYFVDEYGATRFVSLDNHDSPWKDTTRPTGLHRCVCRVPADFFTEGTVRIHVLVNSSGSNLHACEHDALAFKVVDDMDPHGVRGNYPQSWPEAAVRPRMMWTVEHAAELEPDMANA